MNKDMLIRLLALNLGIAAANIAVFSSGLLAVDLFGSALEKAFGSAFLVLSGSGLVYGNYKLLSEPEKAIPIGAKSTKEDYVEARLRHSRETSTSCSIRLNGCRKRIRPFGIFFCRSLTLLRSATRSLMRLLQR